MKLQSGEHRFMLFSVEQLEKIFFVISNTFIAPIKINNKHILIFSKAVDS